MDDIDRQLIALLRENARVPVATLAKKLRVARGTVQNRLAKLEADGTSWATPCGCGRRSRSSASGR